MQPSQPKRSQVVTHPERGVQDQEWIEALLKRVPMGTVATARDGQPFQSTLLFVYEPSRRAIYMHTARRGRVWENLGADPRVCFSAAEMGRLLPASTALNFSVEYSSVVVFGNAVHVTDPGEAEMALQILLDKYFPHLHPGQDYRAITQGELEATAVYRLEIEEWSGKRKAVAEDFPGAFRYGEAQALTK
jgi:uncharacterized protein